MFAFAGILGLLAIALLVIALMTPFHVWMSLLSRLLYILGALGIASAAILVQKVLLAEAAQVAAITVALFVIGYLLRRAADALS